MNLKLLGLTALLLIALAIPSHAQILPAAAPDMKGIVFAIVTQNLQHDINHYSYLYDMMSHFSVKNLTGIFDYASLKGIDILVLLGPKDLSSIKTEYIDFFLREGGSLLLLLPTNKTLADNLKELLDILGVSVLGPAYDNESYYVSNSSLLVHNVLAEHPVLTSKRFLVREFVLPNPLALELTNATGVSAEGLLNYTVLFWGSNTTGVDKDCDGKLSEDEILGQNTTLGVAIETWWGGRILILSSCEVFLDETIINSAAYDNYKLLYNVIYWLGHQTANLDIKVLNSPPKEFMLGEGGSFELRIKILDQANNVVKDARVLGLITQLRRPVLIAVGIFNESAGEYVLSFDVSNISKKGFYEVFIVAYKPYYGYQWVYTGNFTVRSVKFEIPSSSYVIFLLGFGLPTAFALVYLIGGLPIIQKLQKNVREVEDKIRKKTS